MQMKKLNGWVVLFAACSLQLAVPIEVNAEGGLDAPKKIHNGVYSPNDFPNEANEGIALADKKNQTVRNSLNGWKLSSSYFGVNKPQNSSFHQVAKFYSDKNTRMSAGGEELITHAGHQAVANKFHEDKNNTDHHLQVTRTDGVVTYHSVHNSTGHKTEISSWAHPIAAQHAPAGVGLGKVAAGAHPPGVTNSVAGNHPVPRK